MELFEVHVPVKESLHGFIGAHQVYKEFIINAPMVTIIIGDIIWDLKDVERKTHVNIIA